MVSLTPYLAIVFQKHVRFVYVCFVFRRIDFPDVLSTIFIVFSRVLCLYVVRAGQMERIVKGSQVWILAISCRLDVMVAKMAVRMDGRLAHDPQLMTS